MRMRLALAIVVTTEARPRRQIRAPLATARGEYLPGEAAYSSLARRRPQRCARRRAPRAAILVLFGRDERKLRESVRRTAPRTREPTLAMRFATEDRSRPA